VYQKPYPDYYDQLPYPRGYRVSKFSIFSGKDGKTMFEHVGQFSLQCGEASANDALKLIMFPLSLADTAFTWFTSLAPTFIMEILSLGCHILLQSNKSTMNLSPIILGDLGILEIGALI
jgi:hypothetical protein